MNGVGEYGVEGFLGTMEVGSREWNFFVFLGIVRVFWEKNW